MIRPAFRTFRLQGLSCTVLGIALALGAVSAHAMGGKPLQPKPLERQDAIHAPEALLFKTPLGVYHVTSRMPREKLTDFYGSGAFPINYPNEWDKRRGRDGFGIWLHGTPSDTYSRPPRSSDGCVVLNNQDLETITQNVQVGLTPVIISNNVEWVDPSTTQTLRQELARNVESWRHDWESRATDKYLSPYAASFTAGKQNLDNWSQHKRQVNAGKTWIKETSGWKIVYEGSA